MGVDILNDEQSGKAALYCTTSGVAFGPIFDGRYEAEDFLWWMKNGRQDNAAAAKIAGPIQGDGTDARDWHESSLYYLVLAFRREQESERMEREEMRR